MLLAARAERAVRRSDGSAEFRQIQCAIRVGLQQLFRSPHYRCVAVTGTAGLGSLAGTDARNHRVHERLLQRPSYLGVYQDVGGGLGEVAGCFMQAQ